MIYEKKIFIKRVKAKRDDLLNPLWSGWNLVEKYEFDLLPTPLGRQPSEYLKWTQDPQRIGKVKKLFVRGLHNGEEIFFYLSWEDENADTISTSDHPFVDGCAVIIPFKEDAPHTVIVTMGSEAYKVNAWYWKADEPTKPKNVWAKGLGTTQTSKESYLYSRGIHNGKMWYVVIGRKMKLEEQVDEAVQLGPGTKTLISFAVWEGSNRERAGIKAFCPCKTEMFIEE